MGGAGGVFTRFTALGQAVATAGGRASLPRSRWSRCWPSLRSPSDWADRLAQIEDQALDRANDTARSSRGPSSLRGYPRRATGSPDEDLADLDRQLASVRDQEP